MIRTGVIILSSWTGINLLLGVGRQATNKIAGISDEAATFLRGFF